MHRFFIASNEIQGQYVYLQAENAAHAKVLRIRPDEPFIACDENGIEYHCTLTQSNADTMVGQVLSTCICPNEATVQCTIYTAFPKGDKAEHIVQKCVEAGAHEIIFFPSSRCVSRPDGKSIEKKIARWQKISKEAAKQSMRGRIPTVSALHTWEQAVASAAQAELALMMYEPDSTIYRYPLREALATKDGYQTASIMTGPEGGFTREEVTYCSRAGLLPCSMGPRILRCETAPIAALFALMYHTGNLDK